MKMFHVKDIYSYTPNSIFPVKSQGAWLELAKFKLYEALSQEATSFSLSFYSGSSSGEDYLSNYFIQRGYSVGVKYFNPDPSGNELHAEYTTYIWFDPNNPPTY